MDTANSINYATAATYAPHGALSSLTNGSSLGSTLYFNSRLQPCRISVKSSGTAPASCADTTTGNVLDFTYGFSLGSGDNGNVTSITNNRDTTRSQSHFDFSVGATVETAGGTVRVDHVTNLDNNYDQRHDIRKPPGKVAIEKPKPGIDDQVGLNPNADVRSDTKLKKATEDSVTFHELAEAYSKVDHSKQYSEAHQEAIQREQKLRDQRPYLKEHNPGSGPGDRIIIKR